MNRAMTLKILMGVAALSAITTINFQPQSAAAFSIKACLRGHSLLECQCERAIDIGTTAALKRFVEIYGRTNTACNAEASTLKIKVPAKPTPAAVAAAKNNNGLGNGNEGNCTGSGCSDSSNPGNGGTSGGGSTGGGKGGGKK